MKLFHRIKEAEQLYPGINLKDDVKSFFNLVLFFPVFFKTVPEYFDIYTYSYYGDATLKYYFMFGFRIRAWKFLKNISDNFFKKLYYLVIIRCSLIPKLYEYKRIQTRESREDYGVMWEFK